jgi:nitrate reductase gamma subunit
MELFLAFISYAVLGVAYWKGISVIVLLFGIKETSETFSHEEKRSSLKVLSVAIFDIIFFRRLLRVNRTLWFGEWVFHVSFILVVLGHLRYIIDPVPSFFIHLNCISKHAGYILPLSLIYIILVRLRMNKKGDYFSKRNLLLVSLLFSTGITGVIMRFFLRQDIIDIKHYVLGILSFSLNPLPGSPLFIVHYVLFLVVLLYLPSHIIAAPLIMIEARRREETFLPLGHEE